MRCVWANLSKAVFPSWCFFACLPALDYSLVNIIFITSFLSIQGFHGLANSFLFSDHEKHIPTAEILPELKYVFLEFFFPQTSLSQT